MRVVWDSDKDRANRTKHGVGFDEVSEIFRRHDYLEIFDGEHSLTEDRFIAIGEIRHGVVVVIWTERDENTVRIISARWATRRERAFYFANMDETR